MSGQTEEPATVIQASHSWRDLGLREVWEYRELLYFLIWREVKARYRQMALGPLWIVLKPVIGMVVCTVIFGKLAKLPTDDLPKPIFYYTGLLPWYLFAGSTNQAATSLVSNMRLISRVYFPRLIIPLVGSVSGLVDFAVSFIVLIGLMAYYGIVPSIAVLTLPLLLLLAVAAALAVGLWLACVAVKFRDVGFAVGFMTQLWMYVTVIYPSSGVPENWRFVYRLNPMLGVVEGFRWALLGRGQPPDAVVALSAAIVLFFLVTGAYYFRRTERTIVDLL